MNGDLGNLYQQIAALGRRFGAQQIVLFGSRARGDHRERSDIDLAIYGLAREKCSDFEDAIDDLPTLLSFDLVFVYSGEVSPELLQNIERDGINLMTKFNEKYAKFCLAVDRLTEAVDAYNSPLSELSKEFLRDTIIQRFEFSIELAWKTLREFTIEEGANTGNPLNSPKGVVRESYAIGIINNDVIWVDMLKDRNQTSHVYNEDVARNIFARICTDYLQELQELCNALRKY